MRLNDAVWLNAVSDCLIHFSVMTTSSPVWIMTLLYDQNWHPTYLGLSIQNGFNNITMKGSDFIAVNKPCIHVGKQVNKHNGKHIKAVSKNEVSLSTSIRTCTTYVL